MRGVQRAEAFTGRARASTETGLLPRCRPRSGDENVTSAHDVRACMEEPRAVEDLVHAEKFFVRKLRDLICVQKAPGRAHEGNSRTMSMNADETPDEGMRPMK